MNRILNKVLIGTAISGALALTGSALAQPAGPAPHSKAPASCFYAHDWQGWHAPNEHMMYVRVNTHKIYRVDFASSCQELTWPDVHLVTTFHGSDAVCTPLDLDIKVSDGGPGHMAVPCIASGISELTPEEVAAIPKKDLP